METILSNSVNIELGRVRLKGELKMSHYFRPNGLKTLYVEYSCLQID